jgi:hypothetical protein
MIADPFPTSPSTRPAEPAIHLPAFAARYAAGRTGLSSNELTA